MNMISCGQDRALSRSEIVRFGFDTFFSIDRYPFQNPHAVAERNEGVLAPSCWRWCCSATSGSKAALKLGLPLTRVSMAVRSSRWARMEAFKVCDRGGCQRHCQRVVSALFPLTESWRTRGRTRRNAQI